MSRQCPPARWIAGGRRLYTPGRSPVVELPPRYQVGLFGDGEGPIDRLHERRRSRASPAPTAPESGEAPGLFGQAVPAWGIPVTAQMRLEVRGIAVFDTVDVVVESTALREDGRLITSADRFTADTSLPSDFVLLDLPEGYLVSVAVSVDVGTEARINGARVRAALRVPGSDYGITALLDGLVTERHALCWPHSDAPANPMDGVPLLLDGGVPVDPLSPFVTVPTHLWFRPALVYSTFATDATAGDRTPLLFLVTPQGAQVPIGSSTLSVPASSSVGWNWTADLVAPAAVSTVISSSLAAGVGWLEPESILAVEAAGSQAGDAWTALFAYGWATPVTDWLSPLPA